MTPPFTELYEQMSTAIVLLDGKGTVADINAAAEHLIGLSRNTSRGVNLLTRLPSVSEDLGHMIRSAEEQGLTYAQNLTFNAPPLHTEDKIVDCRVSPFRGNGPATVLIEFTDITRRIKVHNEQLLLKQHQASRKMVRQLAHEIKNPLGGIRGAAQLLARKVSNPEYAKYTDVIVTEVDRLAGLANTLLGPGKKTQKSEINIHDAIEHVARLAEANELPTPKIRREYDPSLPPLKLDANQIIQAILNLVNNAIESTGSEGHLTLRTYALANYIIGDSCHRAVASIDVEDDGPGIADEIKDSVFFPLVTGREDGTGLGLPLAQELVNRHDGLIEFVSRPGRTVFSIRLPIA